MSLEPPSIPPSAVKKILKANKDVGKTMKAIPEVMAHTTDDFMSDFIQKIMPKDGSASEISIDSIVDVIKANHEYDFLLPLIPSFLESVKPKSSKETEEEDAE